MFDRNISPTVATNASKTHETSLDLQTSVWYWLLKEKIECVMEVLVGCSKESEAWLIGPSQLCFSTQHEQWKIEQNTVDHPIYSEIPLRIATQWMLFGFFHKFINILAIIIIRQFALLELSRLLPTLIQKVASDKSCEPFVDDSWFTELMRVLWCAMYGVMFLIILVWTANTWFYKLWVFAFISMINIITKRCLSFHILWDPIQHSNTMRFGFFYKFRNILTTGIVNFLWLGHSRVLPSTLIQNVAW